MGFSTSEQGASRKGGVAGWLSMIAGLGGILVFFTRLLVTAGMQGLASGVSSLVPGRKRPASR